VSSTRLTPAALKSLRRAELTYADVGGTRGELPLGYQHLERRAVLGRGRPRFEQATHRLLHWQMHRGAGLEVHASSDKVLADGVAVLRLGLGPLGVSAPVRVVYVVDEPHRQGFAYGSLPGHPERGEEAFVLELGDDGAMTFTIRVFSRPASLAARVGGPGTRAAQSYITGRYLRAL